jgi:mannose-6-phosphate isomerase-like protein (cupin superfamily)
MKQSDAYRNSASLRKNALLLVLFFICLPIGIWKIWRSDKHLLLKTAYSLLGMPLFVVLYSFLAIILFAAFLPPLDLTVGDRKDRTIVNSDGNYSATFIKTARETGNAYEFIAVEVAPHGGNGYHYHSDFDEHFTVKRGTLTVIVKDSTYTLREGQSIVARKRNLHYFRNDTDSVVLMTVKTTPACGLEKSLRVAYGLINTGQFDDNGMAKNPWHMVLLLAYSGTYLPHIPPFVQEPLVNALARIAQWRGEDEALSPWVETQGN